MQATPAPSVQPPLRVLRIDASARGEGSVTRELADRFIAGLTQRTGEVALTSRDLAQGLPFIGADWIAANFTTADARNADQHAALAGSDALVAEVQAADVWVIATPIYNFGVPASLKAWIDQIARAGVTFRYTDEGPRGLLADRKVYILVASGGTEVGSTIDFATPWLRFVLGFLGITDVEVIAADCGKLRGAVATHEAAARIDAVLDCNWLQGAAA